MSITTILQLLLPDAAREAARRWALAHGWGTLLAYLAGALASFAVSTAIARA